MALIPFFVVSALIAGGALLGAAVLFGAVMHENSLFPKAEVAIVAGSDGSDDSVETAGSVDLQTRLAIGLVEGMESVKSICHISYMSPKEAAEGLDSGRVDAALYMPEGMYEDIDSGVNTPVLVRLSARGEALSRDLFRGLIEDGVRLIRTVESAVYSVDRMRADRATVGTLAEAQDKIFSVYLAGAMARGSVFREEGVSLYGSLTMEQYYLSTALLLILLLFGIGLVTLYSDGEREAMHYLKREGLGTAKTSAVKILTSAAVLFIMLLILSLFIRAGVNLPAGEGEGIVRRFLSALPEAVRAVPGALPRMLLTAGSMGVFIHIVYSAADRKRAALIYLLVVLALFSLTGGLLPLPYLPDGLASFLSLTPVPLWQRGLAMILFGL